MHWTPINSPKTKIPQKLADILENRFGPNAERLQPDFVNSGSFRYYVKGLVDGDVEGSGELLAALEKYMPGDGIRIHS